MKAPGDAPIPSGQQRYYDGMLYLLSLLHGGGQFRIDPTIKSFSFSGLNNLFNPLLSP